MAVKALVIGIVGFLSLSQAMCGKSTSGDRTEEPGKDKPAPEVVLEGVDTSALTPREKKEFGTYVSEFLSPCQNVPVSIAQCVQEKRACDKCQPAAKYVLRGVKDGMTRDQIEKAYKGRFDASGVKNVPIDGSPVKGPEGAPVTIVEFADFECPHCGEVAPIIEKVLDAHKNDVRFVYKFYPLPSHPHAEIAARAAAAAINQGKFWEMHHALFANQRHLEQTDIDSYAKELGIDVSRFHADMQANAASDRIAKDKKLGEDLQIAGTPSIYINGRVYDGHQELGEWVTQELASVKAGGGAAPAPAPSGAASAPAGGASAKAAAPAPSGAASAAPKK